MRNLPNNGTILKLKQSCPKVPKNTKGIVFHVYQLGSHKGIQVLFPNGEYYGYGEEEIPNFFYEGHYGQIEYLREYEFQSVIRLSDQYSNGYFNPAFNQITQTK